MDEIEGVSGVPNPLLFGPFQTNNAVCPKPLRPLTILHALRRFDVLDNVIRIDLLGSRTARWRR